MANVISTWSSGLTHIIDDTPDGYLPVNTRCKKTIQYYHFGHFGSVHCSKCGTESEYEEISRQLSEEYTRMEALRKEQMEKAREREEIATKQRKELASRIADTIIENLDSKILQVENWARCDNYILEIEGHKFTIKPVLGG